jgi:hypothetical protein
LLIRDGPLEKITTSIIRKVLVGWVGGGDAQTNALSTDPRLTPSGRLVAK